MNYIRQQVGGKKNRYKEEGYNLDLTYITPRMIAMAFPASGIQKIYRNSVDQVKKLLIKNHGTKFLIVNLSGRQVDESKLMNVINVEWEDHQAPLLQLLFFTCKKMAHYLEHDPQKVVVIHCNHGKGRTGTIVCCFLLYCSMFKNSALVMDFYAKKRFETDGDSEGYGVTQPCQIQYIRYFQQILLNPKISPRVLAIKKLTFRGKHKFDNLYFKLKSFENNRTIVSTKKGKTNSLMQTDKDNHEIIFKLYELVFFCGDGKLEIKSSSSFSNTVFATYSFNTTFIQDMKLIISFQELSPYQLRKQDFFDPNFQIQILFKQICECPNDIDFNLRCEKCNSFLAGQENRWKEIKSSLKLQEKLTQSQKENLLGFFVKEKEKMEEIQQKEEKLNKNEKEKEENEV